jgi:hypothetical protein
MSPQRRTAPGPNDDQDYDRQEDREAVRRERAAANDTSDDFDRDLEADSARRTAGEAAVGDPSRQMPDIGATSSGTDQGEFAQHARRGQAESPVEDTHYEPPKRQEGHNGQS